MTKTIQIGVISTVFDQAPLIHWVLKQQVKKLGNPDISEFKLENSALPDKLIHTRKTPKVHLQMGNLTISN